MRAIKILLLCGLLSLGLKSFGQLKVNDTLPEKARQYKGSLIINFWATWCVPCARELQELAASATAHQGELTVLCVSYEDSATVNKYWREHRMLSGSPLVLISEDTFWSKLFFHQALPHNVWITGKGVVASITGGEEINEMNIAKFLNNQYGGMYQKIEKPFDMRKLMQLPDSVSAYRSVFSKTLPGVRISGSYIDSHNWGMPNMKHFFVFNTLARYMIYKAYQLTPILGAESAAYLIEVHSKDSTKYFWPGEGSGIGHTEWDRGHTYTYELRLPEAISDSAFSAKIVAELEYNLGIKTTRELRLRRCMVVNYSPSGLIQVSKSDQKGNIDVANSKITFNNVPLAKVFEYVNSRTYTSTSHSRKEPYVDATGISGNISFTLDLGDDPTKYRNQEFIEQRLASLGLTFKMETRQFPIVIITDL